jgi:UDPglucose--hexose-1-phosphate uridylyltransferase
MPEGEIRSGKNFPHRRLNPLTGDWVLVSPHRTQRPWKGQVEEAPHPGIPEYDPDCYLCPGNARSGDQINPDYSSTLVFDNDFPALLPDEVTDFSSGEENRYAGTIDFPEIFLAERESGICRVVCFSPSHNASFPDLPHKQIETVVQTWIDQTIDLMERDFIHYIQIFENKGAMMGASNPHPHCQIWATSHIPNEPEKERITQNGYFSKKGKCLLCDYLNAEKRLVDRIVLENEHFSALVPYWAIWPFEIMVLTNRHIHSLPELREPEIESLADFLKRLTTRYDNLFEISFPYSMGFHQAPVNSGQNPGWHLHAHFYPPLLRSAQVRKFMVGFEMLASPQRDITPEHSADRLRLVSEVHYRNR